ncbi:uncharacterized protein IL334_001987 [Kwoniella shivajii]|uniref:Protein kinase domain-containing protein n=1 Tax=Kwoniella shivajii TaxID=564305 RepID=A0ABZ1CV21_9TREE|nr:hypothetical protein IL334_001987 [Kwoniella shivajii]
MDDDIMETQYHLWTPIGQTSNQLILYHPPSHALQVRPHPSSSLSINAAASSSRRPLRLLGMDDDTLEPNIENIPTIPLCPYCSQSLPLSTSHATASEIDPSGLPRGSRRNNDEQIRYFRILEQAHEGSRPPSPSPSPSPTPTSSPGGRNRRRYQSPLMEEDDNDDRLDEADLPAKGYYERFFKEECKLGMGAEGSVFLATHIIGGNVLGTYAVKKIAVGRSKSYLFKMLREVRLLETLRHPNIIPYHHSWIDVTRFSNFGPPITALHVLMQFATAGNLDTYLLTRSHTNQPRPDLSAGDIADSESLGQLPKAERIKAFKKRRQSAVEGTSGKGKRRREEMRGVLLLGMEEIMKLFGEIVEGLAFLHANSILHLDLKCSNVLLLHEDGKLIPKALLSDFGTSEEMLRGQRERTGHTGTMEYMAPETLIQDSQGRWRPSDSHADMWSLGMILHKMLFLHLPYPDTEDYSELHKEILSYPGFIPTPEIVQSLERRHIPRDLLVLLSKLESLIPEERPGAEKVRAGLRGLGEKIRSTPSFSSRAGALVRSIRIGSPWSSRTEDPDQPQLAESGFINQDISDIQVYPATSPVRTILALPSPEGEFGSPFNSTSPPAAVRSQQKRVKRIKGSIDRVKNVLKHGQIGHKLIRSLVFIVKVISLQPIITDQPINRSYMIILLVLAIIDFMAELPFVWSILSCAIHIGVLGFNDGTSQLTDTNGKVGA